MIGARALYGAAAATTVLGAALRVVPPPMPDAAPADSRRRQSPVPASVAPDRVADPARYELIVESNVFSPRRAPPETRFTLDEGKEPEPEPEAPVDEPPPLRLLGVARDPEQALALIEADEDVPGAELYRVGDRVQGGRVRAIYDSTVVVAFPDGPLVLRLPSAREARAARATRADERAAAGLDTGAVDPDSAETGARPRPSAGDDAAKPRPAGAPDARNPVRR